MRGKLWIAAAALALAVTAVPAADESDAKNSVVGGTIPELCQIALAGDLSAMLTLTQDGTGETAYDVGYVESASDAVTLTLDGNKQWKLSAKYDGTGWSCPGSYNKAETDLWIKITNSPTGTIQSSADSYINLGATDTEILSHTVGVSDNSVELQTKVDLDWTQDIPGAYSITIVYTLETTSG